jgi:YD repeat-containing protein
MILNHWHRRDSLNRLIRETDQNSAQVNLTRNGQDDVTTYTDPRALATSYVRNGFGEVIREVSPDSGTTTHVRDARGLITQTTDGRGVVVNMTYDAAGRMLTKAYPAAPAENVTYTYDAVTATNWGRGFVTKIQSQTGIIDRAYDQRGNIKSDKRTIAGLAHTVTYEYDAADRIEKINYPSGRIVTYYRDATGRITQVTTKVNAAAASVTLLNAIVREPLSNLVKSAVYGNGLNDFNTMTTNGEVDVLGVYDGATSVINRTHTRADTLNLTNIFDNVSTANNQTFAYTAANRLQTANGAWGAKVFNFDGVGNRIEERSTPPGGGQTIDTYSYPSTSNRLVSITRGATTVRTLGYDNAGNLISDSGAAGAKTYVYNNRNRLSSATIGAIQWTYVYNGLEQLTHRTRVGASPADVTHYVHDIFGNIIAETDGGGATGATGTVREYIYLPEAEIAPTAGSRTTVDRPIAVVEASTRRAL